MIFFGLYWNLRLVIIELKCHEGFGFLLEDFLKIMFLHGEIFEFFLNSSFAFEDTYFLMWMAR